MLPLLILLGHFVLIGLSALWSRVIPLANWNYLGALLYFTPWCLAWSSSKKEGLNVRYSTFGFGAIYVLINFAAFLWRDFLLGEGFYPGWIWVYLGFFSYALAAACLGGLSHWGQGSHGIGSMGGKGITRLFFRVSGVLLGSLGFFLISNFGVWWQGGLYSPDVNGLFQCYWAALPFFKRTWAADLSFSVFFFVTAFGLAKTMQPGRQKEEIFRLS